LREFIPALVQQQKNETILSASISERSQMNYCFSIYYEMWNTKLCSATGQVTANVLPYNKNHDTRDMKVIAYVSDDFRLSPQCNWDPYSSEMLQGASW